MPSPVRRLRIRCVGAVLALATSCLSPARGSGQAAPRPPAAPRALGSYLRDRLGFSADDMARLRQGEAVTRLLPGATPEEVALVGVVQVSAPAGQALERLRRLATTARADGAGRAGVLAAAPSLADLDELTLPPDALGLLRSCSVGACKLKLPPSLIVRARASSLDAPGGAERVNELFREWLLEYVRGYLSRGNGALVVYGDKPEPLALHEGFHDLLAESPYLLEYVPEFHHYLDVFPRGRPPGASDVLYWSLTDFGLRPLLSVTHATFYERAPGSEPRALVAFKQIYASHYFHARLRLLFLADDDGEAGRRGSYLVYLDRSLFDTNLGWLVRGQVEGRLRSNLESRLRSLRDSLNRG